MKIHELLISQTSLNPVNDNCFGTKGREEKTNRTAQLYLKNGTQTQGLDVPSKTSLNSANTSTQEEYNRASVIFKKILNI